MGTERFAMHIDKARPSPPDGLLAAAGDEQRVILVENIMKKDLERDGVQSAIYKILCCHSPVSQLPCPNVLLPDTLLVDKRVVTKWMASNAKQEHRVTQKMPKKGLTWKSHDVLEAFAKKVRDKNEVVAQFLYKRDDGELGSSKPATMEYLDMDKLTELLTERTETGIIQRFVAPRGKWNETLRVVWTPSVVLMERCRNKSTFKDRTIPLYERTATYDGQMHTCSCYEIRAQPTIDLLNQCCHAVRTHVQEVTKHQIDRMVLFFKVDQKNRTWLTHASSIRLQSVSNAPCHRSLQLEGLSPIPRDSVKRLSNNHGSARCPSCTTVLFDEGNMITVRQAVRAFAKLSATEEFKAKKRCPADDGGHRISSCLLDMRRAIAHEKGDAIAMPSLEAATISLGKKKPATSKWGQVKKDVLVDEDDLLNKNLVAPVLRNLFPKIRASQFKDMMRDANFLDTQCFVCTPCFLIHTDDDLSRKLGLMQCKDDSQSPGVSPTHLKPSHSSNSSCAKTVSPGKRARNTTKSRKNHISRSVPSNRRSASVPADKESRHKLRQAKRKELGLPEEEFYGTKTFSLDRDDEGRLVLPPIKSQQAITRIGMEWD